MATGVLNIAGIKMIFTIYLTKGAVTQPAGLNRAPTYTGN